MASTDSFDESNNGVDQETADSLSTRSLAPAACEKSQERSSPSKWWKIWMHGKSNTANASIDTTWKSTLWRWSPLSGLGSLLFVLLSVPASGIVLSTSDGQSSEDWNISPNVLLATFVGIGNKALGFAALQGALFTWWLRAMDGTNMETLHRDWAMGPGADIWAVLTAGRNFGLLAITTLCTTVILVDGILLQRATEVVQRESGRIETLNVKIAPEIPTSYTGAIQVLGPPASTLSAETWHSWMLDSIYPQYGIVHHDHLRGAPISMPNIGCTGTCNTTLTSAAVIPLNCHEVFAGFVDLDLLMHSNQTSRPDFCKSNLFESNGYSKSIDYAICPFLFIVPAPSVHTDWEGFSIFFGSQDAHLAYNHSGNWTMRQCDYRPAVANYSATVEHNGTITVDFATPKFLAWANNTNNAIAKGKEINVTSENPRFSAQNSSLIGIWSTIFAQFYESASLYCNPKGCLQDTIGTFGDSLFNNTDDVYSGRSNPIYAEPFDTIATNINELMFRTAKHAAENSEESELLSRIDPGLYLSSQVDGRRIDLVPTFRTRWPYFFGAAAIQIICVILVASTYRGYWKLGRTMSLSPLEIAKAFDAPAFRHIPSNMKGSDIAKELGELKVRYGVVEVEEAGAESYHRLIFDEPSRIYRPMNTFAFGP